MKMKKIVQTLFLLSVILVIASCSSAKPVTDSNVIQVANLSSEQQDIMNLLSIPNSQEVLIFDFRTTEAFSGVEFWVEVYQNGELIDRPAGLHMRLDTADKQNGRLAVIINQNDNKYQWTLTTVENGSRASHVGTSVSTVDSGLGRAYGPMNDPASIEDGKEIIIYASTFQAANIPHHAYDAQTLQERPELLNEYIHAHIIKCRFSK